MCMTGLVILAECLAGYIKFGWMNVCCVADCVWRTCLCVSEQALCGGAG